VKELISFTFKSICKSLENDLTTLLISQEKNVRVGFTWNSFQSFDETFIYYLYQKHIKSFLWCSRIKVTLFCYTLFAPAPTFCYPFARTCFACGKNGYYAVQVKSLCVGS